MSKNEQSEQHTASKDGIRTKERKGYKPMQEGYQPFEERGYTAAEGRNGSARPTASSLPKPPKGGTGESSGRAGTNSSE